MKRLTGNGRAGFRINITGRYRPLPTSAEKSVLNVTGSRPISTQARRKKFADSQNQMFHGFEPLRPGGDVK